MKKRILLTSIFCFVGLFTIQQGFAQKTKDLLAKYEYGKQLMANKKFDLAAEVFGAIAKRKTGNDIPLYARYLQASSLYQNKKYDLASFLLKKIIRENRNWNKIDEAKYLLGILHFQRALPDSALAVLNSIRNSSFKTEIDTLKKTTLQNYTADQLQFLYQNFESDTTLGKVLFNKMVGLPSYERNETLFNKLSAQFASEPASLSETFKPVFKDTYNVAVMLPFNVDFANLKSMERSSQIAYEIFQGIQVGQQLLKEEEIDIRLHVFDTQRDSAHTAAILTDSTLLDMDLIIGPLYSSTIPLVAEFSQTYQVPMLNPLSSNSTIIDGNPNAFLLYPSDETQGYKMGKFSLDAFGESYAYIIYGESEAEQKLAESYQRYLVERGAKIRYFEAFDYSKDGYKKLIRDLDTLDTVLTNEEKELAEKFELEPEKKDAIHFFAALNDARGAVSLVSALQTLRANYVNIIAPSKWLTFNQLTYNQLERSNVYLFYPNFYADDSTKVAEVKRKFAKEMKVPPFDYALDGLEAIYTFGKSLEKHGTGFRNAIHFEGLMQGAVYEGIDYSGNNDNQYLPVYLFKEGMLKRVFPTSEIEVLEAESSDRKNKK